MGLPEPGEGRARSPEPLSAEPARCPSGGADPRPDRDPAQPERPPCARGQPGCGKRTRRVSRCKGPKYVK